MGLMDEEFRRPLNVGNAWQSIRICVRYAINTTIGLSLNSMRIGIGLSCGNNPNEGWFTNTTRNVLVWNLMNTTDTGRNYSFDSTAGYPAYFASDRGSAQSHSGSSYNSTNFTTNAIYYIPTVYGGAVPRRGMAWAEFRKPSSYLNGISTVYQVSNYGHSATDADMPDWAFYDNALAWGSNPVGPVSSGYYSEVVNVTQAVSESVAPLDNVMIGWANGSGRFAALEIYDVLAFSRYGYAT